jgi:hypothetical protein
MELKCTYEHECDSKSKMKFIYLKEKVNKNVWDVEN